MSFNKYFGAPEEQAPDDFSDEYQAEPPDEEQPSGAYQIFRIFTTAQAVERPATASEHLAGPETCIYSVESETNDDNDDGWPDGHVVRDTYRGFKGLQAALRFTNGGSRTGVSGIEVTVSLDGRPIHTKRNEQGEYEIIEEGGGPVEKT
ncbi:MAG TPA: hypothetical protein VEY08_16375 [Chloroflexia bacterium]|nr:hypothetical protein [Chloroflexia bacterium]